MYRIICLLLCILYNFIPSNGLAQVQQDIPKPRLNHLAIYVVDVQQSASFYSELFGFDTLPEPFHDNKHAWFSIGPGIALHIIQGAPQPKAYFLNNHMCFSVQSTAIYIEKLIKKGISYYNAQGEKSRITTRIDGVKQVWIQDPDGYYIEINDVRN
jgi:lactoylglutathione lyase